LKETERILKYKIRQLKMKKKNDDENIEIKSRDLNSSEEFDKIYNIRTPKIQN